ncbi:MAG TPA: hypothetical protein VL201_05160 [Patescibacteria group bacterium]|jgi:hypothetical protein|nr:hypothetical protein [Patescibacteria group bacterium]
MKNKILVIWLCIAMISQSHTQASSLRLAFQKGCMAAFVTTAGATAWNYLTKNTAPKSVVKKNRLRIFLDTMYHNLLYIGLPVATVASGLFYIASAQTKKPTQQFFNSVEQNMLRLLPSCIVKAHGKNNVGLRGFEESLDAFMAQYGSPIKTATKTVVVHTVKGIVYVATEVADVLKDSIIELQNKKKAL